MYKSSAVGKAIAPGCTKVCNCETGFCIQTGRRIDNNWPELAKNKIDIIARQKQIILIVESTMQFTFARTKP